MVKVEDHAPDAVPAEPEVVPVAELLVRHPKLNEPIVDGYLRQGETMNVIASPKIGKSWLILLLAFCVAAGRHWLGAHCTKGRVLIVDNELHPATLAGRIRRVAEALSLPCDNIDVLSLRGQGWHINNLEMWATSQTSGKYAMIILDALYRFLPPGTSENDNSQMMIVYNTLDHIAALSGAAIVVVHHSSKGNQSEKAQTDVGSGAGTISRAADTHLTIRHHIEDGYQVVEAVTRSFPSPDPISVYFQYPLWSESDLEPKVKPAKANPQDTRDSETEKSIAKILAAKMGIPVTVSTIRKETGFGEARVRRGLLLLEGNGTAKRVTVKSDKNGQMVDAWEFIPPDVCTDLSSNLFQT